jgi:hypothetical protein
MYVRITFSKDINLISRFFQLNPKENFAST